MNTPEIDPEKLERLRQILQKQMDDVSIEHACTIEQAASLLNNIQFTTSGVDEQSRQSRFAMALIRFLASRPPSQAGQSCFSTQMGIKAPAQSNEKKGSGNIS